MRSLTKPEGREFDMSLYFETSWGSLNKKGEELCGDKVETIKTKQNTFLVLADGLGSGVKANILASLTSKIVATMLSSGADVRDVIETMASTLPVCKVRQVAYSTFAILQIFRDGRAYLVEYDTPACIVIRDGQKLDIEHTERELSGKIIREYRFNIQEDDYFVMMSDGVTHAGVGGLYGFGWGRTRVGEFIQQRFNDTKMTAARLASYVINECSQLYHQRPGDDTTVVVAKVTARMDLNIFTGPPTKREDDESAIREFMRSQGLHVVSGGTSATIAARVLNKHIKASLIYEDPDIPPTAEIDGLDLVTEGVLTLNRAVSMMHEYNEGRQDQSFFKRLDEKNGGSQLAKLIIEKCTHLHLFVGEAMNPAHQAAGLPFDLSVRMRLVDKIVEEGRKMGKTVSVKYY